MVINCWIGRHQWSQDWQKGEKEYLKVCCICGKVKKKSFEEYKEEMDEMITFYQFWFRSIDMKLGHGNFKDIPEYIGYIEDMTNDLRGHVEKEYWDKFEQAVTDGINYLHRARPDNPYHIQSSFLGGTCWGTTTSGPEYLQPHHIPDHIEKRLQNLKNLF